MSSDDGGPGTGSWSVLRSRYNRGVFAAGRSWPGVCVRLPAAASLFFEADAGAVFGDGRAWLGTCFRGRAAAFLLFRVVVLFLLFKVVVLFLLDRVVVLFELVVLVVRGLAFGRLAERRSADDFLV
jgi:hypothetical protein